MNVLVTGARAPIAADIVKALALDGHRVWSADSLCAPLGAASPYIQSYLRLPAPAREFRAFADRLRHACHEHTIDAIVPTSEEVFWLARAASQLPQTISVRTSPLEVLSRLHHKGQFAALACQLGCGAPENHLLSHRADFARVPDPSGFVFKPVYSRFATRTLIAPDRRALQNVCPTPEQPWLAQTLVRGRELCAYNIASAGKLLLHVAYEPRFRVGVGAGMYFSPVADQSLREMCGRFIAATNFTGQISFDVIAGEHGLVALECNPRGTSGVHLAAQQPSVFSAALLGHPAPGPFDFLPEARMLLFPLLLHHPAAPLHSLGLLRAAKDALGAARIPLFAQAAALAELTWEALRSGCSIPAASTADIEWNGETPHVL